MGTQPIPKLTLTANDAQRAVREAQDQNRRSRHLPAIPEMIQRMAAERTVHIFNVGPWDHRRDLGSLGIFLVPACPEGEEYSAMAPIPGILHEPVPLNETSYGYNEEDGRYIAQQIIGVGRFLSPRMSLVPYGVFIAEGKKPTKQELEDAGKKLQAKYLELFQEAMVAYEKGPKEAEQTIAEEHRLAARKLGRLDAGFMETYSPQSRQQCPMCSTMTPESTVLCPNCRYVFDEARYTQLSKRVAK